MIVIKYGGHVLDDPSTNENVISAIANYHREGGKVVVVHGGGPAIEAELKFHNIPTSMVGGYRVTTPEVMDVVQRTLSGSVLRDLTNRFIGLGANAVGLSTGDGNTLRAQKFQPKIDGAATDIGLVGEAQNVNPFFLTLILEHGFLPIISPVAVSPDGQPLNINGDIAAGAIAGALEATEILFITDVAGIYRNWPDPDSVISEISSSELNEISSTFADGMAPKVRAVLNALTSGAKKARIIDGRNPMNLIQALNGVGGTVVYA
jgi:acetylglutamate kinase